MTILGVKNKVAKFEFLIEHSILKQSTQTLYEVDIRQLCHGHALVSNAHSSDEFFSNGFT